MSSSPILYASPVPLAPPAAPAPLAETFLELFAPTRCIGCDAPGELLCEECREQIHRVEQRWACPVCGAPYGWLTCTGCKRDWLVPVVCATGFEGVVARMVVSLKDRAELRLAEPMAQIMAEGFLEALDHPPSTRTARYTPEFPDAVAFVPATEKAFVRRGFDHMELVARELARELGIPLTDVLIREEGLDQRKLTKSQRRNNLESSIRVMGDVEGAHILLADDVVTTGASMQACASALLERGAKSVCGCAMARVW